MDVKKISSVVNSDKIHRDIIDQAICQGDIVALTGSKLKRGYVYNIDSKNIKTYDIDKLIENKLVSAKTYCYSKLHALNISALFSKQDITSIENKIKEIKDTHGTVLNKDFYILYLLLNKNECGLYLAKTKGNLKISNINAINHIKKKYPGYEYIPYTIKNGFYKDYKTKDIKFFRADQGVLESYNGRYCDKNLFQLTERFIVIKKVDDIWHFYMHKNETGNCNNQINRYFANSNVITNVSGQELLNKWEDNNRFLGYNTFFTRDSLCYYLTDFFNN